MDSGLRESFRVECLFGTHKTLGLIPSTGGDKKKNFYHKTVINADNTVVNYNHPLGITSGTPSARLPKYKLPITQTHYLVL